MARFNQNSSVKLNNPILSNKYIEILIIFNSLVLLVLLILNLKKM
jgi:hypothetical protein